MRPQRYPAILALAGLTDPRVTYWEPAKWVARLRATMTGGGPILLRTAMDAGHAGAPGRFDRLDDVARQYAFAIACVEGDSAPRRRAEAGRFGCNRHATKSQAKPKQIQANPNKSKQNCLDLLGFIRPNRDFSMGCGRKK